MKKIGYIAAGVIAILLLIKVLLVAQESPEKVCDIVKHWSIAWLKGGIIAGIVGCIIFAINKYIDSESTMSIVGIGILSVVIPGLLTVCYGYHLYLVICGAATGVLLGYFSYIIDDHLLEVWEIRHITLPIFFGLGFGVSVIIACITENWQDEYIAVRDHAVCTEVTVKRYTYHKTKKSSHYSWDTYRTHYFFLHGEQYPNPQQGTDYVLGTGALGRTDRAEFTHHKWVGGQKLSKTGDDQGFKWIYLNDVHYSFKYNIVYEVEENFFGHIIKEGTKRDVAYTPRGSPVMETLPTGDDVPDFFSLTFAFVKIMATNPDFSLLRWIYLLMYLPFLIAAICIAEIRGAFFLFLISSTVVILIILAALAARLGESIEDLADKFSFGGGSFGGGGASGRY